MDLIEEAKIRYPVGTKYYCEYNKHEAIVKGSFTKYPSMITDGYGGAIQNEGKWARIISYPEGYVLNTIINNYDLY